jgi:rubredoxin
MWQCQVCGFLHNGESDDLPQFCPKCGAPKEKFELMSEDDAEMIGEAQLIKEKYSQIFQRLDEILKLAQEGMDLDMDEGCNKIFNRVKEEISGIHKVIEDELAGHAQLCIWVKVAKDGELS